MSGIGLAFCASLFLMTSPDEEPADAGYRLHPHTADILRELEDTIGVVYYASDDLGEVESLRGLREKSVAVLEAFRRAGGGTFRYRILDPLREARSYGERKTEEYMDLRDAGKTDELEEPEPPLDVAALFEAPRKVPSPEEIRATRERRARQIALETKRPLEDVYRELLSAEWRRVFEGRLELEGIRPYTARAPGRPERQVYSGLRVTYLDKDPEIVEFHRDAAELEYDLCCRIVKLRARRRGQVAWFEGGRAKGQAAKTDDAAAPRRASDYSQFLDLLRGFFDVREVRLEEEGSLDRLIPRIQGACLIVAQPDALDERQVEEIGGAVARGVKTIFLASKFTMDLSPAGWEAGLPVRRLDPAGPWFRDWGIELGGKLLASNSNGRVVRQEHAGEPASTPKHPVGLPVAVATEIDTLDRASPYLKGVGRLVFPATAGIELDRERLEASGLSWRRLAWTSRETWAVELDLPEGEDAVRIAGRDDLLKRKDSEKAQGFLSEPAALVVELRGSFGSPAVENRVLVVASCDLIKDTAVAALREDPGLRGNARFFHRAVQLFTLDDRLFDIARREP